MMKVMGRLSAAGFHRVALVTEFEQSSKEYNADEDGISDFDRPACGGAAVGAVSFSGKTFEATPAESLPVDLISDKDFSEMTKGVKEAPKREKPKPLVRKSTSPSRSTNRRRSSPRKRKSRRRRKKSRAAAAAQARSDRREARRSRTRSRSRGQERAAAAAAEEAAAAEAATQIRRRQDRRAARQARSAAQRRRPAPSSIRRRRSAPPSGSGRELSQSEIDALARTTDGAVESAGRHRRTPIRSRSRIRIRFKRDGTLATGRRFSTSGHGARFDAMRDSAVRAVFVGQPYTMLRPEHYDTWKEIDFTFDTKHMFSDLASQVTPIQMMPNNQSELNRRTRAARTRAPARSPRSPRAGAGAVLQRRYHAGQCAADADRAARFRRRHADRTDIARNVTGDHHQQSAAQRAVRADQSAGLHREDRQLRRGAALSRLARRSTRRRWSPAASPSRATDG